MNLVDQMSPVDQMRVAALYVPMVAVLAGALLGRGRKRSFGALLLGFLWALPALVVLQRLNLWAGWWGFAPQRASLCGMPLELLLGWAALWGLVPQMLLPARLPIAASGALMVALDLLAMPRMRPLVALGQHWLWGEALAVALVLLPALSIARWTQDQTHLRLRAGLQVAISAMLFLLLAPEVAFALRPGAGWAPLLALAGVWRQTAVLAVLTLALPGVAAVQEFAERGLGTPIPYDPPRRLVRSGVYRYCANPMQFACASTMLLWAALLRNAWLLLPAAISIVYSAGIADWDEGEDLEARFGAAWKEYRLQVKNWQWRLLPFHAGAPAILYISATCEPCSELGAWLSARMPVGVELRAAETLEAGSIRRMRYDPGDGSPVIEGVRALGRVLEHLHLGWALAGAALRLPGVWQMVQMVMDVSGLGPREVPGVCVPTSGDETA